MLDTDMILKKLMGNRNEIEVDLKFNKLIEKLLETDYSNVSDDSEIEAWIDDNGDAQVAVTPIGGSEDGQNH